MKELDLPNVTLMAVVTNCFIQFEAQLFTLTIIFSTVAEAPLRSFSMFEGECGYNSSAFGSTAPPFWYCFKMNNSLHLNLYVNLLMQNFFVFYNYFRLK